jgi:hypothetical protein
VVVLVSRGEQERMPMKNVHAVVGVGLLLAALAFQAGSVGAAEETVTGTVSVAKKRPPSR